MWGQVLQFSYSFLIEISGDVEVQLFSLEGFKRWFHKNPTCECSDDVFFESFAIKKLRN
jgi:hypothetical protein